MNDLLLTGTLAYGIIYGIKNITVRVLCVFTSQPLLQSQLGNVLDTLFVGSIIYFGTFGFNYLSTLLASFYA